MVPQVLRRVVESVYERVLLAEITQTPTHVGVIQDGNRRYARRQGDDPVEGHREGADTTSKLLRWCRDIGVEEITLYAFSTENFNRPPAEREAIFDLIAEKLHDFATAEEVHEHEVQINVIGDIDRLPERVQVAIDEATSATAGYDSFRLNVALAYGGRWELLAVAKDICQEVADGELSPAAIDVEMIDDRLNGDPVRSVDLIVRTGGNERTSNFLPWHANGNEAAVYFCTPYWPEFSKIDFLRGIRTYQHRQRDWAHTRIQRVMTLVRALRDNPDPRGDRESGPLQRLWTTIAK